MQNGIAVYKLAEEEVKQLLEDKHSESTKRILKVARELFEKNLSAKGIL